MNNSADWAVAANLEKRVPLKSLEMDEGTWRGSLISAESVEADKSTFGVGSEAIETVAWPPDETVPFGWCNPT